MARRTPNKNPKPRRCQAPKSGGTRRPPAARDRLDRRALRGVGVAAARDGRLLALRLTKSPRLMEVPMMPADRTAARRHFLPALRRWVRSLPVVGGLLRDVKRRIEDSRERSAEAAGALWGEPWMKLVALRDFRIFVDRA